MALGRTITGNEEMRKSCPSPSARFLQGKGVATGVRQVRNRPSKNQPVTKNSVFWVGFQFSSGPWKGSSPSETDVTAISLEQGKESVT